MLCFYKSCEKHSKWMIIKYVLQISPQWEHKSAKHLLVVNYYLMCSGSYRKIFERIMISLKGTVVNQMACTTEYCFTKTRLKKHLLQDLMGVSKIMFILKDPVVGRFNNILLTKTCVILSKSFPYSCHPPTIA